MPVKIFLIVLLCSIALTCLGYRPIRQLPANAKRCRVDTITTGFAPAYSKREGKYHLTMQLKSNTDSDITIQPSSDSPYRKLLYLKLWIGLLAYAFLLSPGGSPSAAAIDSEIIMTMVKTPFNGSISPIFVAIFNLLGVYPLIYASLLLPGAKEQRIPALPFVVSSMALGFFGIGPYLGLREYKPNVTDESRGRGSGLFESKLFTASFAAFAGYLLYYATFGSFDGDRVASFLELFKSQRLVHISTIDFTILTLAIWDPLKEDMNRRGWSGPAAGTVCALPVIGPILYLLTRDKLPTEKIE